MRVLTHTGERIPSWTETLAKSLSELYIPGRIIAVTLACRVSGEWRPVALRRHQKIRFAIHSLCKGNLVDCPKIHSILAVLLDP
jgi:hypothetical protein